MKKVIIYVGVTIVLAFIILTIRYVNKQSLKQEILDEINQNLSSDIIFGDPEASNNIIVYFDYQCGYCQKFMSEVYPEIEKKMLIKEDLRITLRLVCRTTDLRATMAYQTAMCLNQAGDYRKLHRLLMHKPEIIYTDYFNQIKDEYIATNEVLAECILGSDNQDVKRNIYQFQLLNTKGTPTFVVGNRIVKGLKDLKTFEEILESEFN